MYMSPYVLQFNYEAPRTIFWQNLVALALFPVWMQIAFFSFGLSEKLRPLKTEDSPLPSWIQDNIDKSSKKIAGAFFLFGTFKFQLIFHYYASTGCPKVSVQVLHFRRIAGLFLYILSPVCCVNNNTP